MPSPYLSTSASLSSLPSRQVPPVNAPQLLLRRATLGLTHFRCKRVDGYRLRSLEILQRLVACIPVLSTRAAPTSVRSGTVLA